MYNNIQQIFVKNNINVDIFRQTDIIGLNTIRIGDTNAKSRYTKRQFDKQCQ